MIPRILTIAALALAPYPLAAANCQAEPASPSCAKGEACAGAEAVEGGNNMAFSTNGSTITICEAVMCMEGKVTTRRTSGKTEFVAGTVRKLNAETQKPEGPSFPISAMLDRSSGLGHIAWDQRGIMMTCKV